jgi:NAD(P)-dependent dehydrogenase (short-subunit alcohol dehydrogenase family)
MKDFKDRVAVITGGASGIGYAVAERLAKDQCKIVLADVESKALAHAVGSLRERGAEVLGVEADVSKRESVQALLDKTLAAHGSVQLLFNNAGIQVTAPTWQITPGQWEWILGVNLWGVIHGVSLFVPQMLSQGDECHIVNTASMAGFLSVPFMAAYQVTKHSVVTLTETLAQELRMQGARIGASVLCPGFVQTNLHDSDRNRPTQHADGSLVDQDMAVALQNTVKQLVANGKAVEEIAEAVISGIREERTHILTHPEMLREFEHRAGRILATAGTPGG